MSLIDRVPRIQTYQSLLYQRPLHPELFGIQGRTSVTQDDYEVECWILPGGHVVRFQIGGHCLSEVVTDQDQHLPHNALLESTPCQGEKELDQVYHERIRYVTSLQTENLSDNLYLATYQEMLEFGRENNALVFPWTDTEKTQNLSILDVQRYKREIHAQSYHLIGSAGFVLRTQSLFELI